MERDLKQIAGHGCIIEKAVCSMFISYETIFSTDDCMTSYALDMSSHVF